MNAQRWGIPFKFVTYVNSRSLFLFAVGKKLIACVCCFYIHYNFVAYSFTLPSIFTHLPHSPFFLFSSFLHFPILPSFSSFPYSVTLPFSFFFSTFSYSSSLSSLLVFLFPVYLLYVCGLTFHIPFIFLLSLLSLYFLLLFVPFSTFIHQPLLLTLFFPSTSELFLFCFLPCIILPLELGPSVLFLCISYSITYMLFFPTQL